MLGGGGHRVKAETGIFDRKERRERIDKSRKLTEANEGNEESRETWNLLNLETCEQKRGFYQPAAGSNIWAAPQRRPTGMIET
jgi:hypothetical protein